ncbi:MAG: hypothetical protein U0U09_10775 [Cyclobacteriaceae bacterium]
MDGIILLSLFVIAVVIIVGIPLGLSFLILRFIKKGNYDKRLRLIALLPILTVGYFIYTAFFPTESFYKEDFKEVTGVDFPENGEIIYKSATYPDQFGDYGSTSIVKVDKEFYDGLEAHLKEKGFEDNVNSEEDSGPFDSAKISKELGSKKIEKSFSMTADGGIFYYVGFVSDKETLIVQRQSW